MLWTTPNSHKVLEFISCGAGIGGRQAMKGMTKSYKLDFAVCIVSDFIFDIGALLDLFIDRSFYRIPGLWVHFTNPIFSRQYLGHFFRYGGVDYHGGDFLGIDPANISKITGIAILFHTKKRFLKNGHTNAAVNSSANFVGTNIS
jgi:hypothetical protein